MWSVIIRMVLLQIRLTFSQSGLHWPLYYCTRLSLTKQPTVQPLIKLRWYKAYQKLHFPHMAYGARSKVRRRNCVHFTYTNTLVKKDWCKAILNKNCRMRALYLERHLLSEYAKCTSAPHFLGSTGIVATPASLKDVSASTVIEHTILNMSKNCWSVWYRRYVAF